ncbi:DUF2304 domain-containing protein [Eubacterium sp. AM05-23]|uniref:DUF2304 domain-containing protein n=1 Tax=Eubacterium TaxID=1730 RepID=UPI000E4B0E77|nr:MULTISPECIES: DUF2304 domain-containing protein [Eubacterium]RHO55563.1 DUF2304 domain-containing protein [Eubacterium sp. AM05-23]
MSLNLRVFLTLGVLIYLIVIIHLLQKRKLNLKYSLIWLFSGVVMLMVSVFPEIIYKISNIIGVYDATNAVFMIEGIFVLLILLSITSIVSNLNERNRKLVQKYAMLEKKVKDLKKEIDYIKKEE